MRLDTKFIEKFISEKELKSIQGEIDAAHQALESGSCPSSDFLGWLHLPHNTKKNQLSQIEEAVSSIRNSCDIFIVIGIGGSYLGSRAAIEFLCPGYQNKRPAIYFAGNNMDPAYLKPILDSIKTKEVGINVISKSGTTIEPALAFRIIKNLLSKKYSPAQLKKRIFCTTTEKKGLLWDMAKKEGYQTFSIPEDVGGRFSVLTAVGLLPMAVAGIDIKELMKGACDREQKCSSADIEKNLSYKYAALRNILYRKGKKIEIMASFHAQLYYFLEWCKQLFAESEGKSGKGIFPAASVFSTDLHANGQLIQEGERNIFETFLYIDKADTDIKVLSDKDDLDKLNYLSGKGMGFINRMAYQGTILAHMEGGIPNMTIGIDSYSAFCLGELIYFFQRAVGVSGLLLGINPFDQPGVEAYKKNMFKLLGKK